MLAYDRDFAESRIESSFADLATRSPNVKADPVLQQMASRIEGAAGFPEVSSVLGATNTGVD